MRTVLKIFTLLFTIFITQTESHVLASVKQTFSIDEEGGTLEECVVLPQYGIYHSDNKKSAEALKLVKKEFEEVVSIVAKKDNLTVIRIIYTEPNEYRDPVSVCVYYISRDSDKIDQTGARE